MVECFLGVRLDLLFSSSERVYGRFGLALRQQHGSFSHFSWGELSEF